MSPRGPYRDRYRLTYSSTPRRRGRSVSVNEFPGWVRFINGFIEGPRPTRNNLVYIPLKRTSRPRHHRPRGSGRSHTASPVLSSVGAPKVHPIPLPRAALPRLAPVPLSDAVSRLPPRIFTRGVLRNWGRSVNSTLWPTPGFEQPDLLRVNRLFPTSYSVCR